MDALPISRNSSVGQVEGDYFLMLLCAFQRGGSAIKAGEHCRSFPILPVA
jgi:hypothetical protein